MKNDLSRAALCCLLALVAVFCGSLVFRFVQPMEEAVYDLSTMAEDGQEDAGDKGWTVFTEENGTVAELTPNGAGGFSGLSEPGQTFYFSRTLAEELDSPMLRIGVVNRSIAVFLDGEMIYSDCPEQTGGVGTLRLPMREYDRADPVLITLPAGYEGKTLTIAQSTCADGGEKQGFDDTVYPCEVTLYCGYAYESALIAESWQTAAPAAVLFVLGVLLLAAFCIGLFRRSGAQRGKPDVGLLCLAAAAFLLALAESFSADYVWHYGMTGVDVVGICRLLGLCALLGLLASRAGRHRAVLWCLGGVYAVSCAAACGLMLFSSVLATDGQFFLCSTLPQITGLAALLAALIMGTLFWRRDSLFYRLFSDCMVLGLAGYVLVLVLSPLFAAEWGAQVRTQLALALQSGAAYILWRLMALSVSAALLSMLVTLIRQEVLRRTEHELLAQRMQLAQTSFDAMREHNDEIMKLRHDMANHLKTLRNMTQEKAVGAYLDELLGQNEKIRPVVRSGNDMLDILLNSKLPAAMDAGIRVEIVKAEAPEKIPLTNAELSSVILNLMDNAVSAAAAVHTADAFLQIKAQCKNEFFVFSCENAALPPAAEPDAKPAHGLGLKIIHQIAERHECVFTTERLENSFKAIFAVPLQPLR